ncbi:hypothetical protein Tco_1566172 [Tanacetum coccineum]
MPFWKRLLLTSPTPRMEVGETSAAAATRRPRSTMACTVDYSFVDTIDANIRSPERRTMAAIEVVNLRVSYQVGTGSHKRKRGFLFTASGCPGGLSKAHNRSLEAHIATIETQLHRMEWQCQDADDRAVRHIMRIQALEDRLRVDTLEDTSSSS